jgi:hypothetical protein
MAVQAQMSGESLFPGPDGDIWVIGENNTDKNDHISLLDKSSVSILKSVEIEGHVLPYGHYPFLRKGNYLYIAQEEMIGHQTMYTLDTIGFIALTYKMETLCGKYQGIEEKYLITDSH